MDFRGEQMIVGRVLGQPKKDVASARTSLPLAFVAWVGGFLVGVTHHLLFYPALFNGDSSSRTLLAEAMAAEVSLFPEDFYYSTGFGFLSQAPMMAVLSAFGVARDMAFVFGSALNLAFWAVIIFLSLKVLTRNKGEALILTLLGIIPIGVWEAEFLLGQQSSLAYVSLAILFVASSHRFLAASHPWWLLVSGLSVALLSVDSLARALIVVLPVTVALTLWKPLRYLIRWGLSVGAGLIAGMSANVLLSNRFSMGYSVFSNIRPKTLEETWEGTLAVLATFGPGLTNVNLLSGLDTRVVSPLLYVGHFVLLFFMGALFVYWTLRTIRLLLAPVVGEGGMPATDLEKWPNYIAVVSVVGIWVGAVAVAMFYPDTGRQFLWAFFLAKIYILGLAVLAVGANPKKIRYVAVVPLLVLVLSWWSSHLVAFNGLAVDVRKAVEREPAFEIAAVATLPPDVLRQVERVSEETGIKTIYGEDFWRVMPINTLLPDVSALVLVEDTYSDQYFLFRWLTRPSLSTGSDEVMYLVICADEGESLCEASGPGLRQQIVRAGGDLYHAEADYEIWIGPRIWHPTV
jgi:hypothetical protein